MTENGQDRMSLSFLLLHPVEHSSVFHPPRNHPVDETPPVAFSAFPPVPPVYSVFPTESPPPSPAPPSLAPPSPACSYPVSPTSERLSVCEPQSLSECSNLPKLTPLPEHHAAPVASAHQMSDATTAPSSPAPASASVPSPSAVVLPQPAPFSACPFGQAENNVFSSLHQSYQHHHPQSRETFSNPIMHLANAALATADEPPSPVTPMPTGGRITIDEQLPASLILNAHPHAHPSSAQHATAVPSHTITTNSAAGPSNVLSYEFIDVDTTTNPQARRAQICPECFMSFPLKVRFLYHLLKTHNIKTYTGKVILACAKCESAFLRNTDRSKHDLCVHQRYRPFRCDTAQCTSSFFFHKDLVKHKSTVHLRQKPYSCHICPKSFGKREHMTSHIKRVHQKLRPYKCVICDIRLASKYNLQGHLKTAAHAAAQRLARRGMHGAISHRRGVRRIAAGVGAPAATALATAPASGV